MATTKYKDSGIPWIGMIPEDWTSDVIGNLYTLRNEKVSDKDFTPLSVGKMGVVPQLETAAKTDFRRCHLHRWRIDGGKQGEGQRGFQVPQGNGRMALRRDVVYGVSKVVYGVSKIRQIMNKIFGR